MGVELPINKFNFTEKLTLSFMYVKCLTLLSLKITEFSFLPSIGLVFTNDGDFGILIISPKIRKFGADK